MIVVPAEARPDGPAPDEQDVFLAAYLEPFRPFLDHEEVTEILVNRPGEVWLERCGQPAMERRDVPAVTDRLLQRLAAQIARMSHQAISREQPLLAATLPDGARVQIIGPPATREHWALSIRRHRLVGLPLSAWAMRRDPGGREAERGGAAPDDPHAWLEAAVRARRTILVAGGTSSGKTSFLNALLGLVPPEERLIVVEDTPEIRLDQPNALGLVAVRGDLGEARVTPDSLLQASLRMRPDRIVLGELRGTEAFTFLRAINTGHPGSFSTIHANSARGALDQLALLVMQAGLGLGRRETLHYACSVIDVVVHLGRSGGEREITDILTSEQILEQVGR
ncbi:ATPase, T2SS/T4P/T4SS family [Novosphingobium sp.]|uniref:ATPase, T2SS/T4P/T4SS family n=1 Tax=Novosphingobium sp. TaxID=1874826 RepID=UPI0026325DA3|nr:ATPase, T2SS/T4P/T4SS family [Novosphingobium sp.]